MYPREFHVVSALEEWNSCGRGYGKIVVLDPEFVNK